MKPLPVLRLFALFLLLCAVAPRADALNDGTDAFASATNITINGDISTPTALTAFTKEAGEPDHGGGGQSAWWRWTPTVSGICTVDSVDGGNDDTGLTDTVIAVYTGNAVNALTLVARGDDVFRLLLSTTSFYAVAGTTYRIVVDSYAPGSTGSTRLRLRQLVPTAETLSTAFRLGAGPGLQGVFTLTRTLAGSVSGSLRTGASALGFKGVIGADGYFVASFQLPGKPGAVPPLPISVIVDLATNAPTLEITNGALNDKRALASQTLLSAQTPSPMAGVYSTRLGFNGTAGNGVLLVTVKPTGKVTAAGTAGDGQKLSFGGQLFGSITAGVAPIHAPLFSGEGYLSGTLNFTENATLDRLSSTGLTYLRPAGATFFPNGITASVSASGSPNVQPNAGQRALAFLNGTSGIGKLTIASVAGEIGAVTENLTFTTANTFTFNSATRKAMLKVNPKSGLVSGSLIEPVGKTRKLTGILFRDPANANTATLTGFATGSTRTVIFNVGP
jgi:hypothetical protein